MMRRIRESNYKTPPILSWSDKTKTLDTKHIVVFSEWQVGNTDSESRNNHVLKKKCQ
jgi:hypothetical protein